MTLYHFAIFVLLALQIADIYYTRIVLKHGGVEGNPLYRAVMDRVGEHGLIGFKAALALGFIGALVYEGKRTETVGYLGFLLGVYLMVVVGNRLAAKKQVARSRR